MIRPVTLFGDSTLRKVTENIDKDYPELEKLIQDMYETMDKADGVGLAAPQIGLSIRMFVVDGTPAAENDDSLKDFRKVFINPQITEFAGEEVSMDEGCLSIPGINEEVTRPDTVTINYFDENWVEHTETYTGFGARIIQHEYDHLDGKMFVDHVSSLRKRLIKGKLLNIAKGKVRAHYRTKAIKK